MSATFRQYLWRGGHILPNISRGALSKNINHYSARGWAGGKRSRPTTDARWRTVSISKCMSGALRRHPLLGLTEEGLVSTRVLVDSPGMRKLHAAFGDIREIANGGCDNRKFRLEIGREGRIIRCSQDRSVGSGVRPGCSPVATDLDYVAPGTSLEAAKTITSEGLHRRRLLHMHFYECERNGNVADGKAVRCGSDVGVVISARQIMRDGIVFYR